jgi:predicted O-linked N-acetylglucosamine transferase (SPINDLY family)
LPLLTCRGQSFAGRVAASLLHAAGLPELVTSDLGEYERLAFRLASDPALLGSLRLRLEQNRLTCPLFDTDRFRRNIEAAYTTMWELWQRGERPQSFRVPAQSHSRTEENVGNGLVEGSPIHQPETIRPNHASTVNSNAAEAFFNQGNALWKLNRLDEALASYDKAMALRPEYAELLFNRGAVLHGMGRLEEALATYEKGVAIKPHTAEVFKNRGIALRELSRPHEALASYHKAIELKPNYPEAFFGLANTLRELNRLDEALTSYARAIYLKADYAEAFNNRGAALQGLRRFAEALTSYDQAIALAPDNAEALNNRVIVLRELNRVEDALSSYEKAIVLRPDHAEAVYNRGIALQELKHLDEAMEAYNRVIALNPNHKHALNGLADCATKLCDWSARTKLASKVARQVIQRKSIIAPFVLLGHYGDQSLQLRCAKTFVADRVPTWSPPRRAPIRRGEKIKLAYLSADFRRHATAYLITDLLEQHDRSRFEVVGISFGRDDRSLIRSRLIGACDRFVDLRTNSDEEIARAMAAFGTDIGIDLMGHTRNARIGILALRPAPIQVNYLGFPATMGAEFIDYIIADPIVLPFEHQPYFTEKIVHLPDCYQVNDRKRAIADNTPTRAEQGLPTSGFVFCCFNNNWKITPDIFDIWMRLLKQVEGSVLWLLRDNPKAEANLRHEAATRGVDPARLIFADRIKLEDHLARHRLADLFLDTLPCNAHTTASDALWAGLPLLTCRGQSFAGRVAASLLHAAGLPELVTDSPEAYEALALRLATDPALLGSLRSTLEQNRLTCPLFETDRFRRNIEVAYTTMWELWQRGERPRSFSVAAQLNSPTQKGTAFQQASPSHPVRELGELTLNTVEELTQTD